MNKLKARILNYLKNKIRSLLEDFETQILYIHRSEHFTNLNLTSNEPGVSSEKYCEKEVIVSLTTYGKRLYDVYLTIESIMGQTLKPNRIVLWLADNIKENDLPITLKNQQKRGLEIKYCSDIRSYKKLIPSLKEFPNCVIITVDDDDLYNFDLIENLVREHKKHPNMVLCTRMHRIKVNKKNKPLKYKKWTRWYQHFDVSPLNLPVGGGGVLYPPGCFNEEVFNEKVFMELSPLADDIWFKAMALLNNVQAKKIPTRKKGGKDDLSNLSVDDVALSRLNYRKNMNDIQLKAVFDKYNLYERLVYNS